jgi:hypothetical protein
LLYEFRYLRTWSHFNHVRCYILRILLLATGKRGLHGEKTAGQLPTCDIVSKLAGAASLSLFSPLRHEFHLFWFPRLRSIWVRDALRRERRDGGASRQRRAGGLGQWADWRRSIPVRMTDTRRSMIDDLSKEIDLGAVFSSPTIDGWARLVPSGAAEELASLLAHPGPNVGGPLWAS